MSLCRGILPSGLDSQVVDLTCVCPCIHGCVCVCVCVCVCDDVVAVDHVLTEQNLAGDEYRAWRVHFY